MRSDNLKFKDIFWNTLGTVTYAVVSLLISVIIINISGKIEGGIFSFGYSTLAHIVYMIAFFSIRPLHIVDIKYKYSFTDYKNFGTMSSLVAILLGLIYIFTLYFIGSYSIAKVMLLCVLVVHGAVDGYADFYECEFQRVNRLSMCGQSLFFRISLFTITLVTVLIYTQNLFIAEVAALVVELISFYFLNIKRSKKVFKTAVDVKEKQKNLFLEALPLFLIGFLDMYIFSATKFSIDANMTDIHSGFFNLIFMPTNAIYLVMNLIMKPILTPLSNAYYNDKSDYKKLLIKTSLLALLISIVFIVGTLIFGGIYIDIINLITGNIYVNFMEDAKLILLIVIIGGCFYTVNAPLYYALVIEKKQKFLVISYIVIFILSIFVSRIFVVNLGLLGAAIGFMVNMFMICIGVIVIKALTTQ